MARALVATALLSLTAATLAAEPVAFEWFEYTGRDPVFEQPLAHYRTRMGASSEAVLWTARARDVAVERSGYEDVGFNLDHPGFGALTFRRPEGCAGDPISGFSEGVPVFAMNVLPGTIEAEHYDHFPVRGEARTYHDLSPGNAAGLYRDTLGAKVSPPMDQPDHGVTVVFVELPNTKIELLHPLGDDSPIAAFLARNASGGIHHLCFEVDDILAARDKLKAEGARVLGDGEPKIGAHGKPVLFLHPKDFCGTLVELEQV